LNDFSTMNKVLEYMALGRAVVAFDLKETRYSAGDAAVYATPNDPADFGDRILDLLADPARRAEMGRVGQERLRQRLSWTHSRAALVRSYGRLAGLRSRSARPQSPVLAAPAAPELTSVTGGAS
jgi:glycosyltransferase involved in cell wall biosynthesis